LPLSGLSAERQKQTFAIPSQSVDNVLRQTLTMRSTRALSFLAVILACSTALFGQTATFDAGTQAICNKVKDVAVPPADVPSPYEMKALNGCRSNELYFGWEKPKDPVKARKCAFAEIERGANDLDIAGRAVLAMIYANASGVDRNLDLAIKFTCAVQGSSADVAGNIHELARYRDGHDDAVHFNFCDHSSGRHLYEQCVALDERSDRIGREAKLASITESWSPAEKRAFVAFRKAADAFYSDRVANEFDTGTTQVQERAFLERGLIEQLEQLERGELPKFTRTDEQASEEKLNTVMAKVQKQGSFSQGQITAQGINKTQRTWEAYKAAWITFGKKRYPKVDAMSWNTWLIEDRLVMLNKLYFNN
jgi:hypothetical protein